MKRLFISQPMRGKTDDEILAERRNAIQAAKDSVNNEIEVIDSFSKTHRRMQNRCGIWAKA